MDEEFLVGERVPKAEVHALLTRSDTPALGRFLVQYALLVGAIGVVVAAPHVGLPGWLVAIGLGVFSLSVMSMFALMHEAAHGTPFASRTLNRVVTWLTAAPFYYTPSGFREFHFTHHRHTHDPQKDPEISVGGKPAPGVTKSLFMYVAFVTGLPLIVFKVGLMVSTAFGLPVWNGIASFVAPKARARVAWESRALLLLHGAWVAAGVMWLPGLLHLLIGQVIGHALLSWYLIAEHNGLAHAGDVVERTRTMRPGAALKWLMWNMPYHAEHHAFPAVPFHALPRLHALMQPVLKHVGGRYAGFHARVAGSLVRGRPYEE